MAETMKRSLSKLRLQVIMTSIQMSPDACEDLSKMFQDSISLVPFRPLEGDVRHYYYKGVLQNSPFVGSCASKIPLLRNWKAVPKSYLY